MSSPHKFVPLMHGLHKTPIIVEVGSVLTRVGFAGDARPVAVFSTKASTADGTIVSLFQEVPSETKNDVIFNFFLDIFTKHVLCNPKERRIVLLLNPFVSQDLELAILNVLINILEVPSVSKVWNHMTVFPGLGVLHTGIVIDLGNHARIIPVSHNTALIGAWEVLPRIGYSGLVQWIAKNIARSCRLLNATTSSESEVQGICDQLDVEQLTQDLLDHYLVCTTSSRGQKLADNTPYGSAFPAFPNVKTQFMAAQRACDVEISGRFLEEAMEIFFRPDIDGTNLPCAIVDTVLKCPIDLRKPMMENIVVIGGLADTRNFLPRLNAELKAIARDSSYSERLPRTDFMFINCGSVAPDTLAWRGCSILTQADFQTELISKENLTSPKGKNALQVMKEWSYVGKSRGDSR